MEGKTNEEEVQDIFFKEPDEGNEYLNCIGINLQTTQNKIDKFNKIKILSFYLFIIIFLTSLLEYNCFTVVC